MAHHQQSDEEEREVMIGRIQNCKANYRLTQGCAVLPRRTPERDALVLSSRSSLRERRVARKQTSQRERKERSAAAADLRAD
ncbi:hypothetical protein R1flu_016853 [Riccia fluitans]|uniref:Uncharacterized protein n=1 Tax=Riccia fluitans TaxID=41844 RepID=A0ABD1YRY0_9MARC